MTKGQPPFRMGCPFVLLQESVDLYSFYRALLGSFATSIGELLWDFVHLCIGLIILQFKDVGACLCTEPASDTSLFINRHPHVIPSFLLCILLFPVVFSKHS